MLRDVEQYDRRMLDQHKLKATFIRKAFKEFVDEIDLLANPGVKVYYEPYNHLVKIKSHNKEQLLKKLDSQRLIFKHNTVIK